MRRVPISELEESEKLFRAFDKKARNDVAPDLLKVFKEKLSEEQFAEMMEELADHIRDLHIDSANRRNNLEEVLGVKIRPQSVFRTKDGEISRDEVSEFTDKLMEAMFSGKFPAVVHDYRDETGRFSMTVKMDGRQIPESPEIIFRRQDYDISEDIDLVRLVVGPCCISVNNNVWLFSMISVYPDGRLPANKRL
jgi:hypothetical protein